jgi:UDP-glucose 4-epimerase
VERVAGHPLAVSYADRRPGDPPELIADSSRLGRLFGWRPRFDDLESIVRTAYAWERKLAQGLVVDGRAR